MPSRSLAVLCTAVVLLTAGCVGSPSQSRSLTPTDEEPGSDRIQVEGITLEQGQRGNLSIRATQVGEMWFSQNPSAEGITVEWNMENVTFSPEPQVQVDTLPPYWVWENVTSSVTVSVPIRAADNATPGRYTYEISVVDDTSHDHEAAVSETVTVEVVRSSG